MVQKNTSEYDWAKMLYEKCMLDREDADYYATKFVKHDLFIEDLPDLTQNVLKNVGINRQGHCLAILKYSKIVRRELERRETPPAKPSRNKRGHSVDSGSSEESSGSPAPRVRHRSRRSPSVEKYRRRSRSRSPKRRRKSEPSERRRRESSHDLRERKLAKKYQRSHSRDRDRERSRHHSSQAHVTSSRSRRSRSVSRSRSPVARKRRETRSSSESRGQSPKRVKKTHVAHIDRTEAGKQKLTDEDLLDSTIDLPSRFKSKVKCSSVLKQAETRVTRQFKENPEIDERLGLGSLRVLDEEKGVLKKTRQYDDDENFVYIKRSKARRFESGKDGKLKVTSNSSVEKFKKAEKPPNEVSLSDRLGKGKPAASTSKQDKSLVKIEHKEGRFGKTAGMFSLDDVLNEETVPKQPNDPPKERSSSLENRLGSKDGKKSEKNVLSRVGPVKTSVMDRLG